MLFLEVCKTAALYLAALLSSSPSSDISDSDSQRPLSVGFAPDGAEYGHPPKFSAPNGPEAAPDFVCKYPALGNEWTSCSTRSNRGCWLRSSKGAEFNITTDYETRFPEGVTREVRKSLPVCGKILKHA
jgi:hypothetical protein